MELTDGLLFNLYSQLRDPSGTRASIASQQLEEIYKIPASINNLYSILMNQTDIILQQYAICGIGSYIAFHKTNISKEIIDAIIKLSIMKLSKEPTSSTSNLLIKLVVSISKIWNNEWSEYENFILNSLPLEILIKLLTEIIHELPSSNIAQKMTDYYPLIQKAFSTDSIELNLIATTFLCQLIIINPNEQVIETFRPRLIQLFEQIESLQNYDFINRFLLSISDVLEKDIVLIPFSNVLNIVLTILSSNTSTNIKYRNNSFLSIYITNFNEELPFDFLVNLLKLEMDLITQFCVFNNEDPDLLWIIECEQMFHGIFQRFSKENIINISLSYFNEFYKSEIAEQRFAILEMMMCSITIIPTAFEDYIPNILSLFVALLKDPYKYTRIISCLNLTDIIKFYPEIITENIQFLTQEVMQFCMNEDLNLGSTLLKSIVSTCLNSDEIFEMILPFILELTKYSDSIISDNAITIIKKLIETSQTKIEKFSKNIYLMFYQRIIETKLNQPELLSILSKLLIVDNEQLKEFIPNFINLVCEGLQLHQYTILFSISNPMLIIFRDFPDELLEQKLFPLLNDISNIKYDETNQDEIIYSSNALFIMSLIYQKLKKIEYLQIILNTLMKHIFYPIPYSLVLCAQTMQVIQKESQHISQSQIYMGQFEKIIEIFIDKLSNFHQYDYYVLIEILKSLSSISKNSGIILFRKEVFKLIKIFEEIINDLIQPNGETFLTHEKILIPISEIIISISFSPDYNPNEILGIILPFLNNCITDKSIHLQAFSIIIYGELISKNQIPDPQKMEIIKFVFSRILNEIPNVSQISVDFVSILCSNEESRSIIEGFEILSMLLQRLKLITQNNASNIKLSEHIINAIVSLGQFVLLENFPFDIVLPEIFAHLPLTFEYKFNKRIYNYIISIFHKIPQNLLEKFVIIFVKLLARSEYQLRNLEINDEILITSIIVKLEECLSKINNREKVIEQILGGDQYKIECFYNTCQMYNSWKDFLSGAGLNMMQCIDMTPIEID